MKAYKDDWIESLINFSRGWIEKFTYDISVDIWMRREGSYLQRAYWQTWLCHLESRLTTWDQLFATKSCLSSTSTPSFAVGKTRINGGRNGIWKKVKVKCFDHLKAGGTSWTRPVAWNYTYVRCIHESPLEKDDLEKRQKQPNNGIS